MVAAAIAAAVAAGCRSEQPALTLMFESVPPGTDHLEVTLHAMDATFMGTDAGNAKVGVSYEDGNVRIEIDGAYARARLYRIRLPLTAGDMLTLDGTAGAFVGGSVSTAGSSTKVAAGQSATMIFDFGLDGGVDAEPGDTGDGGATTDGSADGQPPDAPDGGMPDGGTDTPGDTAAETRVDATMDVASDATADMAPDTAMDSAHDTPPDLPVETPPMDVGTDVAPTIAINCTVHPQVPASVAAGGSGPTVSYAGGLFGVVWQASNGLSYNAVASNGALQFAQDKLIVSAAGQTLTTPRLARIGSDFVLGYGRRDTSGGQAAVVRFPGATGAAAGQPTNGLNRPGAASPPEIGQVAISADGKKIGVVSRPADLATQTAATVDVFNDALTVVAGKMPAQLGATRTTGIGWATGRFMAAVVTDATSAGGTMVELLDTDLTFQSSHPFTSPNNSPVVGSGAATLSVAGAGDYVAVAWIDLQSARREVWIALYSVKNSALVVSGQASVSSTTLKYYPHVVFDGAAFALAWLEGTSSADTQLKLRRFDTNLAPVAAAMNVGQAGLVGLGDFGLTDAGANVYGVAAALSASTQALFTVTCD